VLCGRVNVFIILLIFFSLSVGRCYVLLRRDLRLMKTITVLCAARLSAKVVAVPSLMKPKLWPSVQQHFVFFLGLFSFFPSLFVSFLFFLFVSSSSPRQLQMADQVKSATLVRRVCEAPADEAVNCGITVWELCGPLGSVGGNEFRPRIMGQRIM